MRDRRGAPTPKRGAGAESPTPTHVAIAECGGDMPKLFGSSPISVESKNV